MATIHLNKGHNLNLAGSPRKEIKSLACPKKIKLVPDDFCGVKPKMKVSIDDEVKIGTKIFFDKNNLIAGPDAPKFNFSKLNIFISNFAKRNWRGVKAKYDKCS